MRKTKTLEISGIEKPITVYELTVKQIIDLVQGDWLKELGTEVFRSQFDTNILPMCSTIKSEQLLNMAPSEAKEIWDAFKEVNSTFFDLARQAGFQEILESAMGNIKRAMLSDFSKLPVVSLNQDMSTS